MSVESPETLRFLDLPTWSRRDSFDYFRGFDKPYFNVCVEVDVTRLRNAVRTAKRRFAHACYFIAMKAANDTVPFRYRLIDGRVRIHDEVHLGGTVLRGDDSIAFVKVDHSADFATFADRAGQAIDATRLGGTAFEPRLDDHSLIHITILPWIHFTSFSHARNWGREDSVPKLAFGKVVSRGGTSWMPMSVEVHHALMDGVHVGRFIERFEALADRPDDWLR